MSEINILVVDDEKEIAELVEIYLVSDGYKVYKADNAPEQKDGKCGYGYQLWACSIPGVYRFDGAQGQYGIVWPKKRVAVVEFRREPGSLKPILPTRPMPSKAMSKPPKLSMRCS